MKRIMFYLTVLFVQNVISQEKIIEVTYQQALIDKKVTKSDNPKILKGIEYKLTCNDYESEFRFVNKLLENEKGNLLYMAKTGFTEYDICYKNLKTKESLWFKSFLGDDILIKNTFDKYKWEITKEEKKIGKYLCRKAISTFTETFLDKKIQRKLVAWFSTEIPLPFGPRGFDGLPGLVLELQDGKNIFIASEVKISRNKKIKITKPKAKISFTRKEFKEFMENRYKKN